MTLHPRTVYTRSTPQWLLQNTPQNQGWVRTSQPNPWQGLLNHARLLLLAQIPSLLKPTIHINNLERNSESLDSFICSPSQSVDDLSCLCFSPSHVSLIRVLEHQAKPSFAGAASVRLLPEIMLTVSPRSRREAIRSPNDDTRWEGRQRGYKPRPRGTQRFKPFL